MDDKYNNFGELAANEREGRDFRVTVRVVECSPFAIVAPHGGAIEPGTTEIADNTASGDFSFYAFEGLKSVGNRGLHLSSTRFDEPRCLQLIARAQTVVTIHGCGKECSAVFLGGQDQALKEHIYVALKHAGFAVGYHDDRRLQGLSPDNLCNRGRSGAGVQLELSRQLRAMLCGSLNAAGRQSSTEAFSEFCAAAGYP